MYCRRDQRRQDELRVLLHQAPDHAGIDMLAVVGEEERHRGEEEVAHPPSVAPDRDAPVPGGITRWNTSCCGIEPSASVVANAGDPGDDLDRVQRGQELELAFGRGPWRSRLSKPPAASPAIQLTQTRPTADHDHPRRWSSPPTTCHRTGYIDEDDAGADQHALVHRDASPEKHVEHQPERGDPRATQPR